MVGRTWIKTIGSCITSLLLASSLVFLGCGGGGGGGNNTPGGLTDFVDPGPPDTTPKPTGTITTGLGTAIASGSIGPGGGQVVMTKSGDPLNGLTISAPPNAFAAAQSLSITESPITNHTFGSAITPVTPMITISGGSGSADAFATIRIPLNLKAGQLASPFVYDDSTGNLVALGVIGFAADHITAITTSFVGPSALSAGGSAPMKVFISASDPTRAPNSYESNSEFLPEVDGWNLYNVGTEIEPDGMCSGMCCSAIYYYNERFKRQGKPHLGENKYSLTDNVPHIKEFADLIALYPEAHAEPLLPTPEEWQDDVNAIRLASVTQGDVGEFDARMPDNTSEINYVPFETMYNIVQAIRKCGPQLLAIFGPAGGHAIVVFQTRDLGNNSAELLVYDPNWPGEKARAIKFENGDFKDFTLERNGFGPADTFNRFYLAGSLYGQNLTKIKQHWAEFDKDTIGNGLYTKPSIQFLNKEGVNVRSDLADDHGDTVVVCKTNYVDVVPEPGDTILFSYDRSPVNPPVNLENGRYHVTPLQKGKAHYLGMRISSVKSKIGPQPEPVYRDFRYVAIIVPTFDGTYFDEHVQGDYDHKETDTVSFDEKTSLYSVVGLHTFQSQSDSTLSGSFNWTGTLTQDPANLLNCKIVGHGTIHNIGDRSFIVDPSSSGASARFDGSVTLFWHSTDPKFGPIGWQTTRPKN